MRGWENEDICSSRDLLHRKLPSAGEPRDLSWTEDFRAQVENERETFTGHSDREGPADFVLSESFCVP
jgi:hypothetical protein